MRGYSDICIVGPWVQFLSERQPKVWSFCQPDALIVDLRQGKITIVEIKLKHTSDAWWQIHALYAPVVKHMFGKDWDYCSVEIAKWFDAQTKFPERFEFVDALSDFTNLEPHRFYVHLWDGRRK